MSGFCPLVIVSWMLMDASQELSNTFLSFSRQKLIGEMWPRLCSCLDELTEEQIWWRPNEASNSIGNLLLHLNGNVRQWILQSIGSVENVRDRNSEFSQRDVIPSAELRVALDATLRQVDGVLQKLTSQDLLRKHHIQVYEDVAALDAIYHVVEHFAMHYGQILYVAKLIRGKDLGFYAHLNQV
ncbi:MAG TPA: DUF1572 family protein [Bryobacteraceae bacterium]|jgi:uncharacterized damage-inducible protein DinB|nr:DUF1572 family protein [Bryobacteraceae bacterium]